MTARFPSALRRLLGAIVRDRAGATAVFLAVSLVPVVGAVGLAVDSSIGYLLRTRMGKSLDAAGLAAGRMALDDDAEAIAEQFFDANFGNGGNVTVTAFDFELDPVANTVTVSAEASTPTIFMRIFGHETMTVAARTVIQRETTGMELALVMDNTGSLWASDTKTDIAGTPFKAVQDAAGELIDIIFGEESEIDNVWVSLVPYVAAVNIGPSRTGWLDPNDAATKASTGSSDYNHFRPTAASGAWKGCVMARAHPWDGDDTPPSTKPFTSFFYPKASADNNFTWTTINDDYKGTNDARKGPNLGCGTPITPLTKSKATIKAGISAMKPWRRGGTTGNLGLAWGWRTISPNWRGLWGNADLPLDYGTDFMDKVVVIMTDGDNRFHNKGSPSDYTAYGRVNAPGPVGLAASSIDAGKATLDGRLTAICTAMKAEQIKIYTIIFDNGGTSAATEALYRSCATTPAMYYYAPGNAQLSKAFRAIGGQLANLRILE